jgi:adenine C2-methylase RlmN of 23S rRNA A2503 and tRNA A37
MIRGIDFVTIEIYGLMQSYNATIEECQKLVDKVDSLKHYQVKVLNHRQDTGYIDVALYPKDGDKRKFIKNLKDDGYIE